MHCARLTFRRASDGFRVDKIAAKLRRKCRMVEKQKRARTGATLSLGWAGRAMLRSHPSTRASCTLDTVDAHLHSQTAHPQHDVDLPTVLCTIHRHCARLTLRRASDGFRVDKIAVKLRWNCRMVEKQKRARTGATLSPIPDTGGSG